MKMFLKPTLGNCLLIVFVTTFLFLGSSYFNTKGEPREALVPQMMLQTGNWILPERYGDVVATKPPMTHWCMAVFSWMNGATVTEMTSRLPSACASLVIVAVLFLFLKKRTSQALAFLSCLLLISTIDFHRSAMAARVDMVLTCFIFTGMVSLYRWYEKGMKGWPILSSFLLSCGTLTKGPIGMILPCFVFFTFTLLEGKRFLSVVWALVKVTLPALILPIAWYVAAYLQGGDAFLTVVLEENLGRFTGKMTYESHENPFYYPYMYSFVGCLPWTFLLILALPMVRCQRPNLRMWFERLKQLSQVTRFCFIAAACVLVFFTIPSSKRAVYQLPAYPFFAYFLALFFFYIEKMRPLLLRIFGWVLWIIGVTALFLFVFIPFFPAYDNLIYTAFQTIPLNGGAILSLLLMIAALFGLGKALFQAFYTRSLLVGIISIFFAIQISLDASVLPTIKNKESIKPFVMEVNEKFPHAQHYGYDRQFWQLNYYLDTKLQTFDPERMGEEGTVFVALSDKAVFQEKYPQYLCEEVMRTPHKKTDVRDVICLLRLKRQ